MDLKQLLVRVKGAKPQPVEAEAEEAGAMTTSGEHEAPTLTCPKCGAELANTPENVAYLAQQGGAETEEED